MALLPGDKLPEFRVALTRLRPGEQAYPKGDDIPHHHAHGLRTKLGGDPDWEQGDRANPACPHCNRAMVFVAQIDSVEHDSRSNPHSVGCLSPDQKWMFGDVGLLYVFFCPECLHPHAEFECG
jgi:hypothetical protein